MLTRPVVDGGGAGPEPVRRPSAAQPGMFSQSVRDVAHDSVLPPQFDRWYGGQFGCHFDAWLRHVPRVQTELELLRFVASRQWLICQIDNDRALQPLKRRPAASR
jgi:hypothetical protein